MTLIILASVFTITLILGIPIAFCLGLSSLAALISMISSVVLRMLGTSVASIVPAFSDTSRLDVANLLISSAASLVVSESCRTSEATTENALPWSWARAASMVAFSDSIRV